MSDDRTTSHHALHSFCIRPDVSVETQSEDEEVIAVIRAHPITQCSWILSIILLFVLLFFLNFILPSFLALNQIIFLNFFIFVLLISYAWFNTLAWFFNAGVITNRRVVDIDFHVVLTKEITDARLDRVEDITAKSSGYFAALFDYGDLFVETAGTERNIEFQNIPKPTKVVDIINNLLGAVRR